VNSHVTFYDLIFNVKSHINDHELIGSAII
jgi:hypothetical protein